MTPNCLQKWFKKKQKKKTSLAFLVGNVSWPKYSVHKMATPLGIVLEGQNLEHEVKQILYFIGQSVGIVWDCYLFILYPYLDCV